MMTPSGIYAFAPFYEKKINITYIKTGSFGELFVFTLSTISAIYFGYFLMPENLKGSLGELFGKILK